MSRPLTAPVFLQERTVPFYPSSKYAIANQITGATPKSTVAFSSAWIQDEQTVEAALSGVNKFLTIVKEEKLDGRRRKLPFDPSVALAEEAFRFAGHELRKPFPGERRFSRQITQPDNGLKQTKLGFKPDNGLKQAKLGFKLAKKEEGAGEGSGDSGAAGEQAMTEQAVESGENR